MDLVELMDRLVSDGLQEKERQCLRRLTPQGMAKINADITRGVDPTETIATLCKIFDMRQEWRSRLLNALSTDRTNGIGEEQKLKLPEMDTNWLMYLQDCHQTRFLPRLLDPTTGQIYPELDVAECGAMYLDEKLLQTALAVAELNPTSAIHVVPTRLAITTHPDDLSLPFCAFRRRDHQHRATVAVNPVFTWFSDAAEEPTALLVSVDGATRLLNARLSVSEPRAVGDLVASMKNRLLRKRQEAAAVATGHKKVRFSIDDRQFGSERVPPTQISDSKALGRLWTRRGAFCVSFNSPRPSHPR